MKGGVGGGESQEAKENIHGVLGKRDFAAYGMIGN